MMKKYTLLFCLLVCVTNLFAQKNVRLKENIDFDWKFILDDDAKYAEKEFSDTAWDDIQLPHDWSIKLDFDESLGGSEAFLPGGIGWYRKSFELPKSYKGKQVSVLFDGICHQSDVYINGQHLGFRPYGFCSIEYDLTPYLVDGVNVIAVRVDRTGAGARWYTGSGIYRHAWLQVRNPVHVDTYGTYITTPVIGNGKADVKIVTTVVNAESKPKNLTVSQRVLDAAGKEVAKSAQEKLTVPANSTADADQVFSLRQPKLWSIEEPNMYTMETTVKDGGKVVDVYTTPFGVRTIHFGKQKLINKAQSFPFQNLI
jgi:beta-galactosidase